MRNKKPATPSMYADRTEIQCPLFPLSKDPRTNKQEIPTPMYGPAST